MSSREFYQELIPSKLILHLVKYFRNDNLYNKCSLISDKGGKGPGGGGGILAGLSTLAIVGGGSAGAYYSLVTVQPGHQGIVYSRFSGVVDTWKLQEGLNFVIPWFHRPIVYDVRTRPQPIDTQSGSKGMQISHNLIKC